MAAVLQSRQVHGDDRLAWMIAYRGGIQSTDIDFFAGVNKLKFAVNKTKMAFLIALR